MTTILEEQCDDLSREIDNTARDTEREPTLVEIFRKPSRGELKARYAKTQAPHYEAGVRVVFRPTGSTSSWHGRDYFEVSNDQPPKYAGQPKPKPNNVSKTWWLREEYHKGRLGKNEQENGKLWSIVLWIDGQHQIAHMPVDSAQCFNMMRSEGNYSAYCAAYEEKREEPFAGDVIDAYAGAYEYVRLLERYEDAQALLKLDPNKIARKAEDWQQPFEIPTSSERIEARKIIDTLRAGMRSLWSPVKRAIVDHATMAELSEGARKDIAAAVGRQRVIEGLRIAASIKRDMARQDRAFWNAMEPKLVPLPVVDRRWRQVSFMNQLPGPAIRVPRDLYARASARPEWKAANDNQETLIQSAA